MNEVTQISSIEEVWEENAHIKKIKKGSKEAFEALYRFYYPRLCQFAFRYVHSKQIAEDLVHDVFYKVWVKRGNLKSQGTLKSYLYTAVRNQALNHLEKGKVRKWADDEVLIELESAEIGPSEELSNKELEKAITEAIEQIPERRRHIFLMHREDQLTYREIAEMLDISVKTVETQMSRSLKFLRHKLAEFYVK
jgi:RNA polymerase sigma-70 factor (ECF subfamily)